MLAIIPIYAISAGAMAGKNIIVFDLETQRSFDEVGGRDCFEKLGISVLGAYLYKTNEYRIFEEKELGEFEALLTSKPLLVGFNSRRFDCAVLQPYVRVDLSKLPQLDILEEIVKAVGHRVKLDSVAQATLGIGKSGSGLDALKYWREGDMESLKRYCLDDVKITKEVYEYGANNGELLYVSKYGMAKARAVVSWKVDHPDEEETGGQMGLF
jgi:DEAD/DEAH box helicase domain-containing protein